MNEKVEFTKEEVEQMLMNTTILLDIIKCYLSTPGESLGWQVFTRRLLSTKGILESKYEKL